MWIKPLRPAIFPPQPQQSSDALMSTTFPGVLLRVHSLRNSLSGAASFIHILCPLMEEISMTSLLHDIRSPKRDLSASASVT